MRIMQKYLPYVLVGLVGTGVYGVEKPTLGRLDSIVRKAESAEVQKSPQPAASVSISEKIQRIQDYGRAVIKYTDDHYKMSITPFADAETIKAIDTLQARSQHLPFTEAEVLSLPLPEESQSYSLDLLAFVGMSPLQINRKHQKFKLLEELVSKLPGQVYDSDIAESESGEFFKVTKSMMFDTPKEGKPNAYVIIDFNEGTNLPDYLWREFREKNRRLMPTPTLYFFDSDKEDSVYKSFMDKMADGIRREPLDAREFQTMQELVKQGKISMEEFGRSIKGLFDEVYFVTDKLTPGKTKIYECDTIGKGRVLCYVNLMDANDKIIQDINKEYEAGINLLLKQVSQGRRMMETYEKGVGRIEKISPKDEERMIRELKEIRKQ